MRPFTSPLNSLRVTPMRSGRGGASYPDAVSTSDITIATDKCSAQSGKVFCSEPESLNCVFARIFFAFLFRM